MNPTYFALMLLVVIFTVAANIMLKLGGGDAPAVWLAGFLSWRSFFGLCIFGCAGLLYAFALRHIPLSAAQSLAAMQYVFTALGAVFILGEALTAAQVFGMFSIVVGIACVLSGKM
jgi:drug/metabolite transporter (DMT)-like permease